MSPINWWTKFSRKPHYSAVIKPIPATTGSPALLPLPATECRNYNHPNGIVIADGDASMDGMDGAALRSAAAVSA